MLNIIVKYTTIPRVVSNIAISELCHIRFICRHHRLGSSTIFTALYRGPEFDPKVGSLIICQAAAAGTAIHNDGKA